VKKFPGPRALQDQAPFNLEFALIADGVPMDDLYPLDVDRAFKKMDEIKDHITVWWKNGAQQIQLLTSAEVIYSSAWNGRVNVAQKKGVPLEIVWQGGCLDQYRKFFSHPMWQSAVLTSLEVSALTAMASSILGVLASMGLVWGNFKAKGIITGFILSPMIVPLIVLGLAYYVFLAKLGLIGTKLGLVIAYTPLTLPFAVLPISATLKRFDTTLVDAAMNLGATRFQTFMKITIPIIRPGVITGALFAFMVAFDEVVIALFICGSTAVTLPKKMWDVIRYENEPMLPAISTLLLLLAVVLLVSIGLLQRRQAKRIETR